MTAWPRAIAGPLMCMARPRRPASEALLVREAAEIVRKETGLTSARALSGEIARRVVAEFMADLEADPLDLAFAAIERELLKSPFQRLALCPDINLASEFVKRRMEGIEDRQGRYLSASQQSAERLAILKEIMALLTSRYDRCLRR